MPPPNSWRCRAASTRRSPTSSSIRSERSEHSHIAPHRKPRTLQSRIASQAWRSAHTHAFVHRTASMAHCAHRTASMAFLAPCTASMALANRTASIAKQVVHQTHTSSILFAHAPCTTRVKTQEMEAERRVRQNSLFACLSTTNTHHDHNNTLYNHVEEHTHA
jgi:hypothetical protein